MEKRNWLRVLGDNLIGYDDGYNTPGEKLARTANALGTAIFTQNPVNTLMNAGSAVKGDLDNLMFEGGAMQRPEAVMGYAAGIAAPGAAPAGALRSGVARNAPSLNPAQAQAQEVIDMLKSGRGADVTDDMLAAADDMYLYNNYDLPMDEASRMGRAQEMGFSGDVRYRGDDGDLQSFRTGTGARSNIGVTSSSSPNVAATYLTKDNSAMFPVMSNPGTRLEVDAQGRSWQGIRADANTNHGQLNENINPQDYLDEDNLFDFQNDVGADWGDGTSTQMAIANTNDVSRAAQAEGFDEVAFKNITDRGGSGRWHTGLANDPATTVMTANPAHVRSRFARFDPRLKNLANLSAAGAGAAYLAESASNEERGAFIDAYLAGKM